MRNPYSPRVRAHAALAVIRKEQNIVEIVIWFGVSSTMIIQWLMPITDPEPARP